MKRSREIRKARVMRVGPDHTEFLFRAGDVKLYFVDNRQPEKVSEQDSDIIREVLQED